MSLLRLSEIQQLRDTDQRIYVELWVWMKSFCLDNLLSESEDFLKWSMILVQN